MIVYLLLVALVHSSSVLAQNADFTVNWENVTLPKSPILLAPYLFRIEYSPQIGNPPSGTTVDRKVNRLEITKANYITTYNVTVFIQPKSNPGFESNNTFGLLVINHNITTADPYIISNAEVTPEGKMLRFDWDPPVLENCTGYAVNYTVLTLSKPKTLTMDITTNTFVLLKKINNHKLKFRVVCVLDNETYADTAAIAFADLRKPEPVANFSMVRMGTDKNYLAFVELKWENKQEPTDTHSLLISYFPGKARKYRKDIVVNSTTFSLMIEGLKPTLEYTFLARNLSKFNDESKVRGIRQMMRPIISSQLNVNRATSTTLSVVFSPTDVDGAKFDKYRFIFCLSQTKNITLQRSHKDKNRIFSFKKLRPGETYKSILYTTFQNITSNPVVEYFTTYPLDVKRLVPLVRVGSVHLFWTPDDTTYKNITYRLSYSGSDGSEAKPVVLKDSRRYMFNGLDPGVWYTFSIITISAKQESDSMSRTVQTLPTNSKLPKLVDVETTRLRIKFSRDMFTESNGVITSCSVIVIEDLRKDNFDYYIPPWKDVQDIEYWPPYQASFEDYNPFKGNNVKTAYYNIGSENCQREKGYCNGPLKPGTYYHVRIRVCTSEDICMESPYAKFLTAGSRDVGPESENYVPYLNNFFRSGVTPLCISNKLSVLVSIYVLLQ